MVQDVQKLPLNFMQGKVDDSLVIYSCVNSFVVKTLFKVEIFYLLAIRVTFLKKEHVM